MSQEKLCVPECVQDGKTCSTLFYLFFFKTQPIMYAALIGHIYILFFLQWMFN